MTNHRDFRETIKRTGFSRANRFAVEIPLPISLRDETIEGKTTNRIMDYASTIIKTYLGTNFEAVRGLNMMAESTELPGININTTENRHNGDTYKLPYGLTYATLPMTFLCTADFYERNIFDEWNNLIIDRNSHTVEYYNNFVTDIILHQLDKSDRIVYTVILKEAFPITISSMTIGHRSGNEIQKFSVEFAYRKWILPADEERDYKKSDKTDLGQTALFPIISEHLNNPVVRKGLDVLKNTTGIDLEGEGLNIYNKINSVVEAASGTDINDLSNILNRIRGETFSNSMIEENDKTQLISIIDAVVSAVRS